MRILIVEDEVKIANSIRKGLEQENMVVDVCYRGDEGYDLASTEEYEVIILDRMLPGMSGEDICTHLRKSSIPTPILMLTAKGQLQDRVQGLTMGADDYLVKPFEFVELLARVRALARRPRVVQSTILVAKDVSLDLQTLTVMRAGKDIRLSKKEFALLELLLRRKGVVVSRETIMSKLWDFNADILPNSVEVLVKHLREKLEEDKSQPELIQTIRGFGYMIKS